MKRKWCHLNIFRNQIFWGMLILSLLTGCNRNQMEISEEEDTFVIEQDSSTEDENNKGNDKFVAVSDEYYDYNALEQLYNVSDTPEKLKEFNQMLNDNFNYFEIYTQPLQSKFYWDMEDKFLRTRADNGEAVKNQRISIDGNECYISSLKTLEVNLNTYNYFLDYIQEGRGFFVEDFYYTEGKIIPVILGNDYRKYYSVGDILELNYLESDLEFEVIGFFEKNLGVEIENSKYDLDTYVCCPFFEIEDQIRSGQERTFWLRYYGQKNMGYIKVDTSKGEQMTEAQIIEAYRRIVNEKAAEVGLEYTVLELIYDIKTTN